MKTQTNSTRISKSIDPLAIRAEILRLDQDVGFGDTLGGGFGVESGR